MTFRDVCVPLVFGLALSLAVCLSFTSKWRDVAIHYQSNYYSQMNRSELKEMKLKDELRHAEQECDRLTSENETLRQTIKLQNKLLRGL